VLTTTTDVAPLAKVQSLRSTQGRTSAGSAWSACTSTPPGGGCPGAVVPHRGATRPRCWRT
jgi:hypothetical protein